jgi:hypothetical protein
MVNHVNILAWTILGISLHFVLGSLLVSYLGITEIKEDIFIILILSIILFYAVKRNTQLKKIQSPLRYSTIYFVLVLIIFVVEIAYFGIPILNDVNYTDFGFPILHHLLANAWILIFTSKKADKKLLLFILFISVCLANRTMFLTTIIAFLMRAPISRRGLLIAIINVFVIFTIIGIIRAQSGAFQGLELLPGIVVPEYLFFFILYLLGPVLSVGLDTSQFVIGDYWNTTPEWMIYKDLPVFLNFYIFYGAVVIVIWLLSRNPKFNYLTYPIIVHLPLTFFSDYLITTTTLSAILILLCMSFRIKSVET